LNNSTEFGSYGMGRQTVGTHGRRINSRLVSWTRVFARPVNLGKVSLACSFVRDSFVVMLKGKPSNSNETDDWLNRYEDFLKMSLSKNQ
jgi:hypothetical protein